LGFAATTGIDAKQEARFRGLFVVAR